MSHTLFLLCFCVHYLIVNSKTNVGIYGLSAITKATSDAALSGRLTVAAQQLAILSVNNDPNMLSDYNIQLDVLDSGGSISKAMNLALMLTSSCTTDKYTNINSTVIMNTVPFILGPPWSSLAKVAAPVFGMSNHMMIGSTASSPLLSNPLSYPEYFRVIPTDISQAAAVINLCVQFSWTSLAILYTSDSWGVYFAMSMLSIAAKNDIDAKAVGFQDDEESYKSAIRQLKAFNIYIICIISHLQELSFIFQQLDELNMFGFPYYYIGAWWLNEGYITHVRNIEKYLSNIHGLVGTVGWRSDKFSRSQYENNHDMKIMFDEAVKTTSHFKYIWNETFYTSPELLFNISYPGMTSFYGWDNAMVLLETLNIFDLKYNLTLAIDGTYSSEDIISKLHSILISKSFYGSTGRISFDLNGDRKDSLWSFTNVIDLNGTIKYIGYQTAKSGLNSSVYLDIDSIVWPPSFLENGLKMPRSDPLITIKYIHINNYVFYIIFTIFLISILISFTFILITIYYHKNQIIKTATWRLNLLICIGCILMYITAILHGFDEEY
eukprot:279832_1